MRIKTKELKNLDQLLKKNKELIIASWGEDKARIVKKVRGECTYQITVTQLIVMSKSYLAELLDEHKRLAVVTLKSNVVVCYVVAI